MPDSFNSGTQRKVIMPDYDAVHPSADMDSCSHVDALAEATALMHSTMQLGNTLHDTLVHSQ